MSEVEVPEGLFEQVLMFHEKFMPESIASGTSAPTCSPDHNPEMYQFRIDFMKEEVGEYFRSLGLNSEGNRHPAVPEVIDRVEELDGLIDTCWVAMGTAIMRFGPEAFIAGCREIARSNIVEKYRDPTKVKIQKSANWTPPNLAKVIEEHE